MGELVGLQLLPGRRVPGRHGLEERQAGGTGGPRVVLHVQTGEVAKVGVVHGRDRGGGPPHGAHLLRGHRGHRAGRGLVAAGAGGGALVHRGNGVL